MRRLLAALGAVALLSVPAASTQASAASGGRLVLVPRDYPSIAEGPLAATGGLWRAVEVTFRRPADGKIDAILDNTTVGEGNALYFRSLEIFEVESR